MSARWQARLTILSICALQGMMNNPMMQQMMQDPAMQVYPTCCRPCVTTTHLVRPKQAQMQQQMQQMMQNPQMMQVCMLFSLCSLRLPFVCKSFVTGSVRSNDHAAGYAWCPWDGRQPSNGTTGPLLDMHAPRMQGLELVSMLLIQ